MKKVKALIFDWGDTIMRDHGLSGPKWQRERVDLAEGADMVLQFLHDKYKCIVATSAEQSGKEDLKKALQRVNILGYFDELFCYKDLGYQKPDIRFFQSILNEIKLNPYECVMIGNSYEKDIVGAKKTGMHTILLYEEEGEKEFPKADKVIKKMSELIRVFRKDEA